MNSKNNSKQITLMATLKSHYGSINCLILLKNGNFATCSNDKTIKIFNSITFTIEETIKEVKKISYIYQLKNEDLISLNYDTFNLYSINNNKYLLNYTIYDIKLEKIFESSNDELICLSHSLDSINFYNLNSEKKYEKNFELKEDFNIAEFIILNNEEIVYSTNLENIIFYNYIDKFKIKEIENISGILYKIDNNLLVINNNINFIDIKTHNIYKTCFFNELFCTVMLQLKCKNIFITGEQEGNLQLWEYNNNNFKLISHITNAHKGWIPYIIQLKNGYIITCSLNDTFIKIWI